MKQAVIHLDLRLTCLIKCKFHLIFFYYNLLLELEFTIKAQIDKNYHETLTEERLLLNLKFSESHFWYGYKNGSGNEITMTMTEHEQLPMLFYRWVDIRSKIFIILFE